MFIEKIIIKEILNLRDIEIDLGKEKKHLILTGKNGCGKTTVLRFINDFFESEIRNTVSEKIINGIDIFFNQNKEIKNFYSKYFIIYFFEAKRKSEIKTGNGVEKSDYSFFSNNINSNVNKNFLKYLVHLKTQQAYAYLNKNQEKLEKINS